MEPLRRSEFWEDTIKRAGKEARRIDVRMHYRPVGLLVVLSFLVLVTLLDHNVPVPFAILLTMLTSLVAVIFS
jgi:hypothetical protein